MIGDAQESAYLCEGDGDKTSVNGAWYFGFGGIAWYIVVGVWLPGWLVAPFWLCVR